MDMAKPKIRFKGYTDDWEQRKLGEIFKEYSEKGHTELPTLTIIQGAGTVKREDSDRNLMYDEANLSNYKMVRKDDFIVHLRSFEGGLEKASLNGIISPAYHTFHSDEADSRFYYPYFRSFEFIKHKLVPHVYGIRDGRSIDIEGMKCIEIPYTSLSEQREIGDYLELLDHIITLHQRKCEETKKLKKYMLQKMFPQNGQTVPEIRFAGFTDAWEQRKLGEVGTVKSGMGFPDIEQGGTEGVPFFKVSDMNIKGNEHELEVANNYVTSEQITRKRWNVINDVPAILFAKVGAAVMLNRKRLVRSPFLLDNNTMVYIFDKKIWDCDFGKTLFETIDLTKLTQVGALPSYNASDVENVSIIIPDRAEQEIVGKYFRQLDHLITLHQHKCEQLQNMKKFMLQNMFV